MYAIVIAQGGKELGNIEFDDLDEFDIKSHIENGNIVIIGENKEAIDEITFL